MNIVFISILLTTTYACIHPKHDDRVLKRFPIIHGNIQT